MGRYDNVLFSTLFNILVLRSISFPSIIIGAVGKSALVVRYVSNNFVERVRTLNTRIIIIRLICSSFRSACFVIEQLLFVILLNLELIMFY